MKKVYVYLKCRFADVRYIKKTIFKFALQIKKLNMLLLAFRHNMVITGAFMFIHTHQIVIVQHLNCR